MVVVVAKTQFEAESQSLHIPQVLREAKDNRLTVQYC